MKGTTLFLRYAMFVLGVVCCTKTEKRIVDGMDGNLNYGERDTIDGNFLQGVWWSDTSANSALFFIDNDSLYYTDEQNLPYFVFVKNNTFVMSRDQGTLTFKLRKLTNDSLIFYDPNLGETKLFKREE